MGCDVVWRDAQWNSDAARKHVRRGPREEKNWERSITTALTGDPYQPSVFDPNLTDQQIQELVMGCLDGTELRRTICHRRTFYKRVTKIIGASEGIKTDFVFATYSNDGSVHGYPVTTQYLRDRGATI